MSNNAWRWRARWSMKPALLLADEPTGDLDESTADSLHALSAGHARRAGADLSDRDAQPAARGGLRSRIETGARAAASRVELCNSECQIQNSDSVRFARCDVGGVCSPALCILHSAFSIQNSNYGAAAVFVIATAYVQCRVARCTTSSTSSCKKSRSLTSAVATVCIRCR